MSEFTDAPPTEEVPDDVAAMFDLKQKKKKKKKKTTDGAADGDQAKDISDVKACAEGESSAAVSSSGDIGVFELDPPTYSYQQLLNRVVDFLYQNNPELTDKKRFTMKPPQLMRGTNNSIISE